MRGSGVTSCIVNNIVDLHQDLHDYQDICCGLFTEGNEENVEERGSSLLLTHVAIYPPKYLLLTVSSKHKGQVCS